MEDISLPHDTRVEDILADYFTKKIEGKDAEAKEKHSDSQHSSKSKKSKKRKHKKKKKHKTRKAHSENEEEERARSSADECWVEVTAGKDKENSAKDKSDSTDKEPKKKQKSKSKRRDASASSNLDAATAQDVPSKDKGGTCKDEDRGGGKGDTVQKEPATKDDVKQAEHTGRTSRRSSLSTSPARSRRASSSSDSDDDHKSASAAEPASRASKAEPPKKPMQKKGRSYRTKRCRSSGSSDSSEDDRDKQSRSRSRSLSQGASPRLSRQNRARSSSRSRRGTQSKDLRQERSKSRDDSRYDRSRDRSRSPKRSSPVRSQLHGQSRSRLSRSPERSRMGRSRSRRRSQGRHSRSPRRYESLRGHSPRRSEVIRNRSPRRTEGRRSRSPRRTESRRSRSPRRPESRRSPSPSRGRGWSGSKQSRGRTPPRRSRSRKRSVSRQRGRRSQSPSSKHSRRSTSRDKRHERKSQSPKGERKSRSCSRKRSVSTQRRSSRHSSSGDSSSDRSKSNERDKKTEEKASSARASTPDKGSASSVDEDEKEKRAKSAEEKLKRGKSSDKESSNDGGKNQVVLYGPFEEEEASFDEEPSPDRAESTTKPTQPETCSGGAGKNVKNQPATSSLDAVPLPAEPAAQSEDTQLEDMDISDSPSSGGVLEVEDSLSQSLTSGERHSSPSVSSQHQTETRASQQCVPPQKVPTSEETLAKTAPTKAAIPWTYAEMQPPPPPPWLKPEVTKPVGQVRPFVREVNPSELAAQKGLLQGKQEGVGAVGSLVTVQPSTDPPLIAPDKSTYRAEELSALANSAAKAAQQSAFPDVSAKLIPQISLATVPPPPVNVHSGALYSATVMPVHVPYQFMGLPGHGQVGPGATLPVAQEKSAHVTEQHHEQCPPQPQQSRDNQPSDSADSTSTAPQLSGPPVSESNPPSPTKKSEVTSKAPDVGVAEEAKDGNESGSSSRSSSPAEGRSRSSSKERLNSRTSRSRSGDREIAKRSRSSESRSPSSDAKRLRKDDRADSEEKRTKSEGLDRHVSASPDRKARDSRARKKSVSPDRKQSKTNDRKRSKSRDRRRSKSRDRRSKSRDRRRSQSRDRKRSPIRERRRSKSRERRPSKSRERRRSKSRDRKRSKSRDRKRSKSRERKRSKSRERKRSKSRDRRRSKSRDRKRSRSRDRKRSKSRERRTSVGRSGTRSARRRSASRSRRSRSRDQTKRRSQSRERARQRRSQSKGRDSSRRKSRDREAPRGGLILKRYKNELSSESDSSPERKSKAKPSSPVKKRQRRDSDAESVSSGDDKPEDNRVASPMMSDTDEPDADGKGDDCTDSEKEKELEKQQSSETASKDKYKDAPYGPLPPNEAVTPPAPKDAHHSDDEMDDEQDVPAGSNISSSLETKAGSKALHTQVVSSSSSKESICLAGDTSLASSKGHGTCSDSTARRSPELKQERQERSTNKGDKMNSEKLSVPCGESAVSSSTGSPGQPEERPKSRGGLSEDLNTKNISGGNSSSVRGPPACTDPNDDGEKKPSTTTDDKAKEASYNDDTRSTSDNERKSRSRSPSSTSSIERARTRRESSSSSTSPSPERDASKEPSKSRSTSPDSPDRETRDESPEKKSRSRDAKRSRSREKKRSKSQEKRRSHSREKKRSHSREKKRSLSREKKRSKSRERRMSRSRDRSRRSKERKRSRSREKKRSPSREKRRSRSREKRRSRSRDKRRSRSRERKPSPSRDKRRSRSREKKRSISRDRRRSRSRDKRRSRSRDKRRSLSRDRRRSRERRRSRDRKSPSRSRDRRRSRERRPRSRSRPRRSWSRAMELQRKRSAERLRKKSRSPRKRSLSKRRSPPPRKKSRSRSRRRSRTHSPPERKRKSRSRERMLPQGHSDQQGVSHRNRESREPSVVKVDKAQLLEAARKNMQAMLQRGVVAKGLPVAAAAAVNATVKVVAAAVAAAAADPRSSLAAKLDVASSATSTPPNEPPVLPLAQSGDGTGPAVTLGMTDEPPKIKKSLAALTEICRAISDEEKREYAGEVEPKTAEEVAEEFQQTHHHPFKLKEPPPPIRFNIPNATNLPVKTLAEKVADAAHLHKQFPVSSGNQHRVKELEWVPVEKTEPAPAPKVARAAAAKSRAAPSTEGGTSPLALMPPPLPKTETFSPLPTVATPPVFQVEDVPLPVSSAVISSTVMEPPDPAPAGKADTAKTDKGTALLEAKDEPPEQDSQASVSSKDEDCALDLHTKGESPPGKSDCLDDDSKQDKAAVAKHENVDESQCKTQCNAFSDDPNPTFLIEEVPLESIPLPEGPYVPPETHQSQLSGSPDHQDETSVSVQDTSPQSQKAKKPRKWDNALEQRPSKKAELNDIKESLSESSKKTTAKRQIETEVKPVKHVDREPTAEVKNREVTPRKRRPCTETKEPSKPELSSQSNLPASRKSELDIRQKTARIGESKNKEKTPAIGKVEQHPLPEVPQEVDKVVEPKQAPEPTDMRSKLQKLRRESIMSMLKFEPLEITQKIAPIQSFEMKQDGASLCKQAWSRISASQKQSAYFSSENKKESPEPPRPVQNKKDSTGKIKPHNSQSLPKLKNPSIETEEKLSPIDSTDTVQKTSTGGHGGTMASQHKCDRFLHQQIQENVVTKPMPGYLTFGNMIVNPAPPVQPPERHQANSSPAEVSGPPPEKSDKNAVGKDKHESEALPASSAAEDSTAIQKQPKENLVTLKEMNRHSDTDSKRSLSDVHFASTTENRVVTDTEPSAKCEAKDGNKKTSKGECGELPVKSQEHKHRLKEHTGASPRVNASVTKPAEVEKPTKGQETIPLPSSKSVPHKQTQDRTTTRSKESAKQTRDGTPTGSKESVKQTRDSTPTRSKESAKQTQDGTPTRSKESAKQTRDGTPTRSKESAKQTPDGTPRSKESAKQTRDGTPTGSKESTKQTRDSTPTLSKESAKQTRDGTPTRSKDSTPTQSKESAKQTWDGTPTQSKESAKQTRDGTPTQSKESAKQTRDSTPTQSKESAKQTRDGTPTRSKESAKQTRDGTPARSKESAKQTQDSTPTQSKESAKQTRDGTPTQSKESTKPIQNQLSVAGSVPKTDSRAALSSKNETPSHKTKSDILPQQEEQIQKAESAPKLNEKIAVTRVSELQDSRSVLHQQTQDSTPTLSKESERHIQKEVSVAKTAPKTESRTVSSMKKETPSCHTKSENVSSQQKEQLRKAELLPNEKIQVTQMSELRNSKHASTSTQSKESAKHIPKHVSDARTALKRESHTVSSSKKETSSRQTKSANLLPKQQEQTHKAGLLQKPKEKVAATHASQLQDKVLLPSSKSMPLKHTQGSTPTQSKESAKHLQKHALPTKIAPEGHSSAVSSPKNEEPPRQTISQNLLPEKQEEKRKAESSPKTNEKIAATQVSELRDKGNTCQQLKSTVVEDRQDQLAVQRKEQAANPLKESIAPGKTATHHAASMSTLPSDEDKAGESKQVSVVQRTHHGTDVIHKPNNVPVSLALTQSTTSSVEELDGAAYKHAKSSTEPVTPVCKLAAPPSLGSPASEQKVQGLLQEVSTKERSIEREAVARLSSAQAVPAECHSRHNAGDGHKKEHSHDHRQHQQPGPLHKTRMHEKPVFTSGLANRAEPEGILPQQGNTVTVNTEYIYPSLKQTNVVLSTSLPSPGSCATEVKALLPESDNKDATTQLQQNPSSAETSGKPVVHELENLDDLSDNSEAKSTKYGSSLEQSQIGSDKQNLPRKKQLHVSQEPAGKASKSTLPSTAVNREEGEKLAADVAERSLPCLPTESIKTKSVLDKMAPGASEILTSYSEQEPNLTKYDDTTSSKSYQNEVVLPILHEEKSSAQQGELKSDHIEEASDLADKLMQPEFGVTGDQPQMQAVTVSSENLTKKPTIKDGEGEGTLLSFHQMQATESDVTDKAEKHAVHTTTGTAPAIQSQFEKKIGAEDHPDTALRPVEDVQTESVSLLFKNANVIVEQIISVSDHMPEHSAYGSREPAHPVCGTNKFEKKANNGEKDLNAKLLEDAEGESNIPSKEHASTKKAENEGPLEKEPQDYAFKPEIVETEESTINKDRSSTLKHSDDQQALFTDEERVSAMQGDVESIVFEQSDDSGKHALEVKSDSPQEGVIDIVHDLIMMPTLEGGGPTASLLPNQETMTLSQTELKSQPTEKERRNSCSELVSRNEMDVLQDATAGTEQDYTATPELKGTECESAKNQKWTRLEQEVVGIPPPIEAVANKSASESVFVGRIGSLDKDTACAEQDHLTVSILSHVEAEPMLLLPIEEKTSTELTSMKGREEAKSVDTPALEDGAKQLLQSSAVTEHNVQAALPTKVESENMQVLVTVEQTDINSPQERTAPIIEEMCVLEVDVPAAQALASNPIDLSGLAPLEINRSEVSLVHTADEVRRANCVNEESKTNSGDDVKKLHKEHKVSTEYEVQPTPLLMAESFSQQTEQDLSGYDESVKHAPEHAAEAAVAPVPNENVILVLTVAEELSEESRHDETDHCQQQDHIDENTSRPTQHSTPSHRIQTKDEVATIDVASPPCGPKREDDTNLQQNTVIQPEQSSVSASFDTSAESTLFASSLQEHGGTSAAEAAIVLNTQEHSVVGLEGIEVATVIEVSAEDIVLSTDLPPTLGCQLTETSQQVYAPNTNEQCSLLVSTTEGSVESIDYAVAHPALLSSDQGSVELLIIGSCAEEHTVVPLAGQQLQDDASAGESADEALGTLSDSAVLSPEAVLNELLCEDKVEATSPAIIGSSSHLRHSLETELDAASRLTVPSETRLESHMLPLTTPSETQLADSSVVLHERQQSDLKPLSFTACHADSTQKSSEQPTENSALQPRDADKTSIGESSLSSHVVVSPPTTNAGNEEASLNVTSAEESIYATCSLPPAVSESSPPVEAEERLVETMEQAEPAREVTLAGHEEAKHREQTHTPMPLRKRMAMRQLPESVSEETPPLPEQQSPSSLGPSIEETSPEEQKPKKAVAKPKRRGRGSQARSQGEGDEAETQQVRRSTRNKKAPERFCF